MKIRRKIISLSICLFMLVCLLTVATFAALPRAEVTSAPVGKSGLTYLGTAQQLIEAEGAAQNGTMQYSLTGEAGSWTADATAITGTEIKAYTVYYKAAGDGINYDDSAVKSITVNINKERLTIHSASVATKAYDGTTTANGIAVTFKNSKGATVVLNSGTDYTIQASYDSANAGSSKIVTVQVTLKGAAGDKYILSDGSEPSVGAILLYDQVINKQTVSVPTIETATYTGSLLKAEVPANIRYTVAENNGGIYAGKYDVVLRLANSANYKWATTDTADVTLAFYITKALNTWSVTPAISDWTYGGTASKPVGSSVFGNVIFTYYNSEKTAMEKPSKPGLYYMRASVIKNGDNYDALSTDYIAFYILRAQIEKPAPDSTLFVYNKKEQTFEVDASNYYIVDGNKRTFAGTQTVTITLREPGNYEWDDGSTAPITYSFTIKKQEVPIPLSNPAKFTYNGEEQAYTLAASDYYTVTNNIHTDAGSYNVLVALKDKANCCWADDWGTEDKTYTFVINVLKLDVPPIDRREYFYNGFDQTYGIPTSVFYTISGNVRKETGTNTVVVELIDKSNFAWKDGTTTAKEYSFVIKKQVVVLPTISSKPYNEYAQRADISENDIYMVKQNSGGINVGGYDVVLELKDTSNYRWASSETSEATTKFYITKAVNEWTSEPTISGWTYGGTEKEPAGAAKFGEMAVSYYDGAKNRLVGKPVNAGTYYMVASVTSSSANYDSISSGYIEFVIEKAVPPTEFPADIQINSGKALADIDISKYAGYTWDTPNTLINCGINEYSMTFTPSDSVNYVSVTRNVVIEGVHNFSVRKTDNFYHWFECSVCKNADPESKEEHTLLNCSSNDNGTHTGNCKSCNTVATVPCAGGEATCVEKAVCLTCEHIYGELNAENHDFNTPWQKDEDGHWHYCTRCGANEAEAAHIYDDGLRCTCGNSKSSVGLSVGILLGTILLLGGGTFVVIWFIFKRKFDV